MANLLAAKSQADFPPFAERQQLAADKTRFCIDSIKLYTQKDGKERWYLTVHFVEGDEVVYKTLTLDRSQQRDEDFGYLMEEGDFPQHNCWLEKATFKGKDGMQKTSYRHKQVQKTEPCACNWASAEQPEWDMTDYTPEEPPAEPASSEEFP